MAMTLSKGAQRALLAVCIPFAIVGVVLFVEHLEPAWSLILTSLILALCVWADGRKRHSRRQWRRIGMILSAPWLALWLFMLAGNYFYQGSNCLVRLGNGRIEIDTGAPAALALIRLSPWPT